MRIMLIEPNPSGAYSAIHERDDITTAPNGCYEVAEGVSLTCSGYGALTIVDNIVTAFTPNEAAWSAWQAANPTPAPEPTIEQRTTALEATQSDVIDVLATALGVTI